MAGSRRRSKKHAPKVRVGVVKRSRKLKAPTPLEIAGDYPAVPKKLGKPLDWSSDRTLRTNYQSLGFAYDANLLNPSAGTSTSRPDNSEVTLVDARAGAGDRDNEASTAPEALDRDLLAALGKQVGPRKIPEPLTAKQRQVVSALIGRHRDDVDSMVKDSKLNKMLLPASRLKRMIEAYHLHSATQCVAFHQPKKRLW